MKQKKSKTFIYFLLLLSSIGLLFVIFTDVPVKTEIIQEDINIQVIK